MIMFNRAYSQLCIVGVVSLLILWLPTPNNAFSGDSDQEGSADSDYGSATIVVFSPTNPTEDPGSTLPSRIPRVTTEEDVVSTTVQSTMASPPPPLTEEPTTLPITTEASTNGTLSVTEAGTEDPEIDEECRVPGYASINYETTFPARVTNEHVITLEGRCYLGCMKYIFEDPGLANFRQYIQRDTSYPPWPFHTLATSDRSCALHKYVHECTRGCVASDGTIAADANGPSCESQCVSGCQRECGFSNANECGNPDSDEWWVRQSCPLTCDAYNCGAGCYAVSVECTSSDCQPPLTPVAPPTLTPVSSGTRAGVYDVNLTQTVPSSPLLSHNVAFLFKIFDLTTGNYSYHWLVLPETLDLADFSCREVSVRFAVANMNGLSEFSESFRVPQVYGDRTRRPNPAMNMRVSQVDDTRVGYFGHVIWNITWDHPQSLLHLEGYSVTVFNPYANEQGHCGLRVWTQTLNRTEPTSVTVLADEPGDLLVMDCIYTVEIHALGLDERETVSGNEYADMFPSRPQFVHDLSCNKIWDTTDFKFSFNFTWSLPLYIAAEDPIDQYIVSVELVRADSTVPVDSVRTNSQYSPPNKGVNETSFYYYVPHNDDTFFRPKTDPDLQFRFKLFILFNESNIRFPSESSALPTRLLICTTDAISPAPSVVQNLTLISYEQLSSIHIALNFSWVPPATPNGVLISYSVCLSQRPLEGGEEPPNGISFCDNINGNLTEASLEMSFLPVEDSSSYNLYFQIRAYNEFVFGDWNEAAVIDISAPVEPVTDECKVPVYSSIDYETTYSTSVRNEDVLVLKGRCYLACMEYAPSAGYERFLLREERYPPWPYLTLKKNNCNPHKYVHECTRGCVIANSGSIPSDQNCQRECFDDCYNECGLSYDCDNPDSDEWWVRETCSLTCRQQTCAFGCQSISLNCNSPDCQPPLTPVAPPTLAPVINSTRAGVYDIDLTQTVPSSPLLSHNVSHNVTFLFEILDMTTGNYSYHWLVHPETLDLADFSCREVSVRFAVANTNGLSEFSESIRVPQVYGDSILRPSPAVNMRISQVDDTRVGYFGHVIWTISWDHPQSLLHLEGYTVTVFNPYANEQGRCGLRVWTQTLNRTEPTAVTVSADEPGNLLVIGCTYTVEIHALGPDDSETISRNEYADIFPSRPQFVHDLSCNKIWDTTDFKFSFNFTWSLPLYIAAEDPIDQYIVSVELVRADSTVPVDSVRTNSYYSPPNKGVNETSFYYYVPHNEDTFFRPKTDSDLRFRFKLFFLFDNSNVRFPSDSSALPSRQFICTTDTISPAPSVVQNLTLICYEKLNIATLGTNVSWVSPAAPNGILISYYVCLSQRPLVGKEEPPHHDSSSFCETMSGDLTEISLEMTFLPVSNNLYFQIRAHNEFVFGDWNEPAVIDLGVPGSCTEATSETPFMRIGTPETDGQLEPSGTPDNAVLTIGVPVIVILIALLCCCVLVVSTCFCIRRRRRKWRVTEPPSKLDLIYNAGPRRHLLALTPTDPQLPEIDEWEISPSEVLMEDSLGEGAFGEVYKGVVKGPLRSSKVRPSLRKAIAVPVAIKLLKESARGSERQDFLSEIDMMKMISEGQNPNVIGLIGCVTLQEPLSLILEYVTYGDLLSYLRTNMRMNAGQEVGDHDNPYLQLGIIERTDLVKFSYQIASGMEHLSSLGIVHRDLACRNILVDEGKVLKITDFGMSREVDKIYVQQSKGRVPLKWMALESILTRQFTTASDVWSYGIVLWEISTMGGFPYPSINNEDLILHLKNGYRMEKPENCSPEIYDIMLSCWDGDPSKRPSFSEMRSKFDKMLQSNAEYIYFLPVNSNKACYKPENAPEGMAMSVAPVQLLLTPNLPRNRMSLCSYREAHANEVTPSHQSIRSGNHSGRNSGHSSPGQRSPRSVSPAVEPSPHHNTGATRSTSVHLSRDANRDARKRAGNLYVQDPSRQLQGNFPQVRPLSMLVSRPSANLPCSSSSQNISSPTANQSSERRRPSSLITPGSEVGGSNGEVPGYVNVTKNGVGIGNGGFGIRNGSVGIKNESVLMVNPLFGLHDDSEEHTDREQAGENELLPGIQITVTQDF